MFSKRLQILLTPEQHRALGERARADGASIGQVVREAIDEKLKVPSRAERKKALESFLALGQQYQGPPLSAEDINRIVVEEVEAEFEEFHGESRREKP